MLKYSILVRVAASCITFRAETVPKSKNHENQNRTLLFYKMIKTGKVYGVDHMPALVEKAKENVEKAAPGLQASGGVTFLVRDGRKGLPEYAPFDCIHVGAGQRDFLLLRAHNSQKKKNNSV